MGKEIEEGIGIIEEYFTGVDLEEIKTKVGKKYKGLQTCIQKGEVINTRVYQAKNRVRIQDLRDWVIGQIPKHRNGVFVLDLGIVGYYLYNPNGDKWEYKPTKPAYIKKGYRIINVKEYYIVGWYKPY